MRVEEIAEAIVKGDGVALAEYGYYFILDKKVYDECAECGERIDDLFDNEHDDIRCEKCLVKWIIRQAEGFSEMEWDAQHPLI